MPRIADSRGPDPGPVDAHFDFLHAHLDRLSAQGFRSALSGERRALARALELHYRAVPNPSTACRRWYRDRNDRVVERRLNMRHAANHSSF